LFRNPIGIFTTVMSVLMNGLLFAAVNLLAQAIGSTSQGAGIAIVFLTGGPLGALAAGVPKAAGGITIFMGALTLASGNPGGVLTMISGGLSRLDPTYDPGDVPIAQNQPVVHGVITNYYTDKHPMGIDIACPRGISCGGVYATGDDLSGRQYCSSPGCSSMHLHYELRDGPDNLNHA
jgi:hypothetical protein